MACTCIALFQVQEKHFTNNSTTELQAPKSKTNNAHHPDHTTSKIKQDGGSINLCEDRERIETGTNVHLPAEKNTAGQRKQSRGRGTVV